MLVFDFGFTMWAARIRNLREQPSPGVFESLAESLAEGLVKRALASLGRGPGGDGSSRRPGTSS